MVLYNQIEYTCGLSTANLSRKYVGASDASDNVSWHLNESNIKYQSLCQNFITEKLRTIKISVHIRCLLKWNN